MVAKTLLSRCEGQFKRNGLIVNGIRYRNISYKDEYLEGKKVIVAYDSNDVSKVFLIENGNYIEFELIEKELKDKTLEEVGVIKMNKNGEVSSFREKNDADGIPINGGFMVLDPKVIDMYIEDDDTIFEKDSLERIAEDGQLMAFRHDGFWQCMDTQRDKESLEKKWKRGEAPWKKW